MDSFSCSSSNVTDLGNGLVVDSSFAQLPQFAQQHIATIGINHGLSGHDSANSANWANAAGMSAYAGVFASCMVKLGTAKRIPPAAKASIRRRSACRCR